MTCGTVNHYTVIFLTGNNWCSSSSIHFLHCMFSSRVGIVTRDIDMGFLSVCPSVSNAGSCVETIVCTVNFFYTIWYWHFTQCFKRNPEPLRYSNPTKQTRYQWFFGREDRYLFACRLRVKSLIRVENHLRGFHRNGSTIAGFRASWARTFNSGILA